MKTDKSEFFHRLVLLLLVTALSVMGFMQMFEKVAGHIPSRYGISLAIVAVLCLVLWVVLLTVKPYANQNFFFGVVLLSLIGCMEIIRIDYENVTLDRETSAGANQVLWLILALGLASVLLFSIKDYRVFRKFSYISMIIGLFLLFSPMIPGVGASINGARIWIRVAGHSIQPAEFAKLFMAIFLFV